MPRVLIGSIPFAERDRAPVELLERAGIEYVVNPLGRKLKEDELIGMIGEFDAIIAGTEPLTARVLERAGRLKLIARMGIGLDSVALPVARARGIRVTYTPDVPTQAVADLAVGMMFALLRQTHVSSARMHAGQWVRFSGRRLVDARIGLIGAGPIGVAVLSMLSALGCRRVLVHDIKQNRDLDVEFDIEWCDRDQVFREADVVSLHVPLTDGTRNMVGHRELGLMKPEAVLVNTARGGLIDEPALVEALVAGRLGGAAIDVFEQEPYEGPLRGIDRCLLTAHMGAATVDSRSRMELEATREVVRCFAGEPLGREVPDHLMGSPR